MVKNEIIDPKFGSDGFMQYQNGLPMLFAIMTLLLKWRHLSMNSGWRLLPADLLEELMEKYDLSTAHEAASFNRDSLEYDGKCGCFYCLSIFSPSEINEWVPEQEEGEEVTAVCPHCGIDAVIGESSGFPITQDFLRAMNCRWFGEDDGCTELE